MRQEIRRRRLLAGGAAAVSAGAIGLAAWRAGKSSRVRDALGIGEPPLLQDAAALKPTEPPALVADAALLDAAGIAHTLSSFTGSGLVLNFWATWCQPCVVEMPALEDLARRVGGENIVVLAASSDRGGAATVSRFFAAHRIEGLTVWLDPDGAAGRALGTEGITPTTLIIDRAGRERARLEGPALWDSDAMVTAVRRLAG
jgi:thiol-disulfide isomerase/thioredoxin